MSGSDVAKKLHQKFARLGKPPAPTEAVGNLHRSDAAVTPTSNDPSVQLNLRVPETVKRRVRVLAVRDRITVSEVVVKAIELYEEKYGSAPEI